MTGHLKVVVLSGVFTIELVDIVPKNVPALTKVKVGHFLDIDLSDFDGLLGCKFSIFEKVQKWSKVHKVPGIDTDIHSVNQVNTLLASSLLTIVFDVIDYQSAVMYNLAQCGNLVNFLTLMPVEFGNQHAKNGPPPLSSSVQ